MPRKSKSKSKPLVYLVGPISDVTFEGATSWRKYAGATLYDLDITCIDPMRGKEMCGDHIPKDKTFNDVYDKDTHSYDIEELVSPLFEASAIFRRDRWDVYRCDAVLAHLAGADKVSIGSVMEIAWAHAWNKLVVATLNQGDIHDHGMLRQCMSIVTPSLSEAIHLIATSL